MLLISCLLGDNKAIAAQAAVSSLSKHAASGAECPAPVTGAYRNEQYGFAFVVPKGLEGSWQSPCSTGSDGKCICIGDHGLAFDLGGGAVLGVFADYAAELDHPTLGDVLRAALDRIGSTKIDDGKHIRSVQPYRLQGHMGYRITAASPDPNDDRAEIDRIELIFLSGARYDIYVYAPRLEMPKARKYLLQLLQTWKWIPTH